MEWLKRILIAIAILALAGLGSLFVYSEAYSQGETAGYEDGYSTGHEAGYDEGCLSGKRDGYTEGYSSGKADGYEEGVQASLGHGYTLKNPTYRGAVAFLRRDSTDGNNFIEDGYVCSHFARDVCNNAEAAGLRCAFISLRYPDGGHAIIAFETVDEGLIYFDPQTDEEVKPVIGKRYYQCVEPKPGYYYEEPSFDDTIKDILVIW